MSFVAGLYQILNRRDGKRYIGSSQNIRIRFAAHRNALIRGDHHCSKLRRAWAKHGADAFKFATIVYCDIKDLLTLEARAMDAYSPEYNTAPVAGTTRGIKYSDESRAKISAALRGNRRSAGKPKSAAVMAHMTGNKYSAGVKHSQEWRDAMSARVKGNKFACGGHRSPEHRAAIAAASRGNTYNVGRVYSDEERSRISKRMKGIWAERKANRSRAASSA